MSGYVTVARAADIPAGEARVFQVNGRSLALCHVADNGFYAIDNVCTHDSGPLGEGILEGDRMECPRHGALFDVRTGAAKTLPAIKPVRSYPTRLLNDEVQVALEVD